MHTSLRIAAPLALAVSIAACHTGSNDSPDAPGSSSTAVAAGELAGRITIDGSSTVLPVSKAIADAFHTAHAGVQVAVHESGTGGGFIGWLPTSHPVLSGVRMREMPTATR